MWEGHPARTLKVSAGNFMAQHLTGSNPADWLIPVLVRGKMYAGPFKHLTSVKMNRSIPEHADHKPTPGGQQMLPRLPVRTLDSIGASVSQTARLFHLSIDITARSPSSPEEISAISLCGDTMVYPRII